MNSLAIDRIKRMEIPRLVPVPISALVRKAEWFRDSGMDGKVKIYAFPPPTKIFSNKIFSALGLFEAFEREGRFKDFPTLVVPTSGNLGKEAAFLSRHYPVKKLVSVVNFGTQKGKINHLRASGANPIVAPEGIPATDFAREQIASLPRHLLMDQYTEEGSIEGHLRSMRHAACEMIRLQELAGYNFCAVTGTGATLMAANRYLRDAAIGKVKIIGVASGSKKDKVPGSRSWEDILELERIGGFFFREEWKSVLDFPLVTSVTKHEAFSLNPELAVDDLMASVGPTSALLVAGIHRLLRDHAERGALDALRNERGECVFTLFFMDSFLAYIEDEQYLQYFENYLAKPREIG